VPILRPVPLTRAECCVPQARKAGRGDSVAVIGCGVVGDAAIAGANLAGAAKVIAVDIDDRKLDKARTLGATHTVNSSETDRLEVIRELTGGFGADVVIEAVGRPEIYQQAFYARDLAGTVVLVGVPTPEMKLELPLLDVFGRGGALKSSWYGGCLPSGDFPMLIDLHLQGRLPLDTPRRSRPRTSTATRSPPAPRTSAPPRADSHTMRGARRSPPPGHFRFAAAPPSRLFLTYGGCTMEWHVSLTAVDNPVLLYDADGYTFGEDPHDGLRHATASLRKWLWTWADGADVWEEVQ
jgi:hypothetical protein